MKRKIINLSKKEKSGAYKSLAKFKGTNFTNFTSTLFSYVEGRISKKQFILITQDPENNYYIANGNFGTLKILKLLDRLRKRLLNEINKNK